MKECSLSSKKPFYALLLMAMISSSNAGEEVPLIRYMGTMQYMAHKADLAIHGKNQPLASFYVHEIEQIIERLEGIDSFDGHAIGSQVKSLLVPAFEALEASVKAGDWDDANTTFDQLLASCNRCHEATGHAYVHIQRSEANPFMQSFKAR